MAEGGCRECGLCGVGGLRLGVMSFMILGLMTGADGAVVNGQCCRTGRAERVFSVIGPCRSCYPCHISLNTR